MSKSLHSQGHPKVVGGEPIFREIQAIMILNLPSYGTLNTFTISN